METPLSSFSDLNTGELMHFGNQVVRHDRSRTTEAYKTVAVGGAAQCKCSYCRNFIAQRGSIYPVGFIALLDELEIDPDKEGEVYEFGPAKEGYRCYGGWFFFVGQILEAGESKSENDGVTYQISDGKQLPQPDGDFGLDLLALNFNLALPWVLKKEA